MSITTWMSMMTTTTNLRLIKGGLKEYPYYILDDDGNVKGTDSLMEWRVFFKDASKRRIAEDFIRSQRVSSVFIGLDHGFSMRGPPIVFETMIFGGPHDGWQVRSSSREGILDHHKVAVKMCMDVGFWALMWWNIGRYMNGCYEKFGKKINRVRG